MSTPVCKNHRGPRGRRAYALGAAVITVLLASTACGQSEAATSDDAKSSDRPSVAASTKPSEAASTKPSETAPTKPSEAASVKPSGTSGTTGGNSGTSDSNTNNTGAKNTLAGCAEDALAVSATKEPPDSKEARHLLITVQNVGNVKCNLYRYPHIRLGADAQTTVPVIEDSDPDPGKPVTIAPGEEAYAALLVSGGARDEYEAKSITLRLQGSKVGSDDSGPIDVTMPVKTLYADDGQLVTYWTTASGFALDFIMSK